MPGGCTLDALQRLISTALHSRPGEASALLTRVIWQLATDGVEAYTAAETALPDVVAQADTNLGSVTAWLPLSIAYNER